MGELYNPYPKLPKNIRQIGERDQSVRLYLEDYVNTYLKRLYPKGGQDLRVGVLLGLSEEHDGVPYLFVDGALEMEEVTEHGEKVVMNEAAWKKTYQTMEEMFPKRVVLGWFLCGAPGAALSPLNYWKQHGQYFPGKNQLMYLNAGLDGEEAVYVTSEDGFYKLRGHSIYYERNQMMQDYMIMRKDARRVESGGGDSVIRDFRQRMEDNRSQVTARRSTIRVLGMVCSALAVTVLAGSVVMFNNYEKMREMESVLASVLPGGIVMDDEMTEHEPAGDELWVEEAAGNVYPTQENETMSDTYPGSGDTTSGTSQSSTSAGGGNSQGGTSAGGGNSQGGTSAGGGNGQGGTSTDSGNSQGSTSAGGGNSQGGTSAGGGNGQGSTADAGGTGQGGTAAGSQATGQSGSLGGNKTAGQNSTEAAAAIQVIDGQSYYRVQDGETLYGICLKLYGTGSMMDEICEINGLEDENKIISGQNLILP